MEDFTTFICFTMRTTMKKLEKYLIEQFDQFNVSPAQSFVLISLLDREGCTLTEVSNRAFIENSSLTNLVDRLERDGLVVRKMDGQDRRAIRLYLTDNGRTLAEKTLQALLEFNNYLKTNLGELEDQFKSGLSRVSEILE